MIVLLLDRLVHGTKGKGLGSHEILKGFVGRSKQRPGGVGTAIANMIVM
jgi:hypothetical protein